MTMIYSLVPALASLSEPVASIFCRLNEVILGVERVGNISEPLARDQGCHSLSAYQPAWKQFLGAYGSNKSPLPTTVEA
ncbi:hypothetical protein QIS74_13712 [Colletotrichum tabaci]|uniref:Uncharacterized protein n=1 Tax=Colletotrichum tabaci TaxID=1209068 RepID=A0AAV9SV78_9PEZI